MSLKHGDLKGTVLPEVSIDEFEPKAGDNMQVIVVAFYLTDKEPAEDLNTFIQRGFIDALDVEVSPSTDADGRYLVFVEMNRDDTFPNKFQALIKDIENLTGQTKWQVRTYLSEEREFLFNDPELFNFIIINPDEYVPKDEFKMQNMDKSITEFFSGTLATGLTIVNDAVILSGHNRQIVAEVIDVGDYDTVIGRNFLSESAFGVGREPYEAKVLSSILGNCTVLPLGKFLCISKDDTVMLLKNTQIKHGR